MLGDERAQQLLHDVHRACVATLPTLSRTRKHPSRDLCGAALWETLSQGGWSCAGMCIAFMERNQHLPLTLHRTRRGKGSRTYWITGPRRPSTAPAQTRRAAAYRGSVPGVL